MINIRNYHTKDFSDVKKILEKGNLFWEKSDNKKELEKKIKKDPLSIIVAVENNKIVGTQFIVTDFMPFLFRLAVHPDYRGRGIGMKLMQKGEKILRKKGHNHVNILVSTKDKKLQNSYKKQGYKKGNTYRWMMKEFD